MLHAVRHLGPLFAGLAVAGFVLALLLPAPQVNFSEIGLGIGTTAAFGKSSPSRHHCTTVKDAGDCIEAAQARKTDQRVLWLGASQLHAINDMQSGDRTAPQRLFDGFAPQGLDLVTFSQPNANFQEHLILFEYLRSRLAVKGLVLGAVFDDMRESGVRQSIASALDDPAVRRSLATHAAGRSILVRYGDDQSTPDAVRQDGKEYAGTPAATALDGSLQARVETTVDGWLGDLSRLWRDRGRLRSSIIHGLRQLRGAAWGLRNRLLGIDSSRWTVAVPRAQYDVNRKALATLLDSARAAGVPVLLYICPRPVDAYFPFAPERYAAFKDDIARLAAEKGALLANLEDAVKGDVWGRVDNGVGVIVTDVFHFRDAGHAQLAAALRPYLARQFLGAGK